MPRFLTRGNLVDAERYMTPGVLPDLVKQDSRAFISSAKKLSIQGQAGVMIADVGDWVVKGKLGTLSVWSDRDFRANFDELS